MGRWLKLIFGISLSLHFWSILAFSQNNHFNPNAIYQFATYLYETGDYPRAAAEYERYLFFAHDSARVDSIIFKIALSYRHVNEHERAINYFRRLTVRGGSARYEGRAEYEVAYSLFKMGHYGESILYSREAVGRIDLAEYKARLNMMVGINRFFQKDWQAAEKIFSANLEAEQIPEVSVVNKQLKEFSSDGQRLPNKSPVLAGLMSSVIPGTGKIYAGRSIDGIYSLILVSLTAWQSYEGFNDAGRSSKKGWIYGSISAGFHLGNIYGTVISVRLYNEEIENQHVRMAEGWLNYYLH